MTVKKRLRLSNMLMIAVPVLIGLVFALGGFCALLNLIEHGGRVTGSDSRSVFWTSHVVAELAELALEGAGGQEDHRELALRQTTDSLTDMLDANQMRMVVERNGERILTAGTAHPGDERLMEAVRGLDTHGATASLDTRNVLMTYQYTEEDVWHIFVLGTQTGQISTRLKQAAALAAAAVLLAVALAVFVMNRFLVRFVIRRIEQPLDMLAQGVRRIGEGELDCRIEYAQQDEFLLVCQAFNEMAARLKESVERTQREEQSRKMLIAGISHDLRSPLTSVQAYAEGLLDGIARTPEAQKRYLLKIKEKAEDINRLITQLFLFSKLDMEEYPMQIGAVRLDRELGAFLEDIREEYRQKGLEIQTDFQAVTVLADCGQMQRVILNVLDNSVKFKDKPLGCVRLTLEDQGEQGVLRIEDDGPGVSPEEADRLFDVFYRTDRSRKNPAEGSGLGLAIVAKIVRRMGGSIRAESAGGRGLILTIGLPKEETEHAGHSDH